MPSPPLVGDIIRIIRQPDRKRVEATWTGLYGFVAETRGEELFVIVYFAMAPDKCDCGWVLADDIDVAQSVTWSSFLIPLIQADHLERMARKAAIHQAMDGIVDALTSPEMLQRADEIERRCQAWAQINPSPYEMSRGIRRDDKGDYLAATMPEVRAAEGDALRLPITPAHGYAIGSIPNRVTLRRARSVVSQASLWPDHEIVRNLVRELDLDPYADPDNAALYGEVKKAHHCPTANLRRRVIGLLNDGFSILKIFPVKTKDLAGDEVGFWTIAHAKRLLLPEA
jgi:hypothetical protein